MQKLLTFFSKNISVYAIFNDQSINDTLTNDIVSYEQLDPERKALSPFRYTTFDLLGWLEKGTILVGQWTPTCKNFISVRTSCFVLF